MIFKQLFDQKSSTYTYLIASAKGREALIIDPVIENVNQYVQLLKELNLNLVKVIDTHIHADHVTGASKLKDITKCTTIMGDHSPANTVEIKVKDDEYINLDTLKIRLINGTGRTDFQNGNAKDAYNSIFNKLLKLPEETFLYPAHDYKGEKVSTIGKEKKQNPRLQVNSVDEYVEIMNNLNLKKPAEIETNVAKNIRLGA